MATKTFKKGQEGLVSIIGDEDTVTGFLLAGVGDIDPKTSSPNFLIVDSKVTHAQIEESFKRFTSRQDIAILLITQQIADDIRYLLNDYNQTMPAILEIPSKEMPYDPNKDYILMKVNKYFGDNK